MELTADCTANSGCRQVRAPVLGPNEFYISTKKFRNLILINLAITYARALILGPNKFYIFTKKFSLNSNCIQARAPDLGLNEFYSRTKKFKKAYLLPPFPYSYTGKSRKHS